MSRFMALLSFAVVSFAANISLACSCLTIANAQQAANSPSAVVAKVSTVNVDEAGKGTLKIEKLIKGQLSEATVQVQGADGANCSSEILPAEQGSWMAIFYVGEDGAADMGYCGNASLPINEKGDVEVVLSQATTLTEQEFSDFVNLQSVPTVEGLSCYLSSSRYYTGSPEKALPELNFYDDVSATLANKSGELSYTKDFSAEGLPELLQLEGSVGLYEKNNVAYVYLSLAEPFAGYNTSTSTVIDVTKVNPPLSLSLNASQKSKDEPEAYHYLNTYAQCELRLSKPLLPLQ